MPKGAPGTRPPACPAPPNFRPKGRVRRARCAWRGHNFLSPSEAPGARQLPGRGRTSEGPRPRAHLFPRTRRRAPGPAAALKFPALPLCGGRRRAPSPRSPRRRPGADPRAGPGRATCWKPLASGPLRPPAPAPRPRGATCASGSGRLPGASGAAGVAAVCAHVCPRAPSCATTPCPAGGAHGTRGLGRSERWTRGRPGVRRLQLPPRTSGPFLSPRPPTSGGSPRAPSGALIRSR